MRRRVSAISGAALVIAALISGCGGGHTSGSDAGARSSATSSPRPATTRPATTRAVTQAAPGAYLSYENLLGRLAGRTLALPRGVVHLQSALLECNGEGNPVRTGTTRRWSRYTCTQTLFQNGVDRDVTFEVTVVSPTRLSITSARYGAE